MIDFKQLEMADIEVRSGTKDPAVDRAFSEFLSDRRKKEEEMQQLRKAWDDFEVVPYDPTPEEVKEISEFLKKRKAKEAQAKAKRTLHSRTVSTTRKK